jgi:hypothetical protein
MIGDKIDGKIIKMVTDILTREIYIFFTDGTTLRISADSTIVLELIRE